MWKNRGRLESKCAGRFNGYMRSTYMLCKSSLDYIKQKMTEVQTNITGESNITNDRFVL